MVGDMLNLDGRFVISLFFSLSLFFFITRTGFLTNSTVFFLFSVSREVLRRCSNGCLGVFHNNHIHKTKGG